MIKRKIITNLLKWAKNPDRKPLILRGARQVGKTTVANLLGKEFSTYVYLNLENPGDLEIFSEARPVHEILQLIFLSKNVTPVPGDTLIFIDEIQNSPVAVAMMRYFYESAKEYHILAAGSLLEVLLDTHKISFPVGRVEYRFLYPLSFEEFLLGEGNKSALEFYNTVPCPDFASPVLMKLFHTYTLIGGMPEVVSNYLTHRDFLKLKTIYQSLITSYQDDVSKYANTRTMTEILRFAIEAAPREAGKRIKFHGFGNSSYRSREMGEALRNLERAMLLHLIYPITNVEPPMMPDRKKSPKLQFLDTGLLNYVAGLQAYYLKSDDLQSFYQGILAEHIVCQELIAMEDSGFNTIAFWVREQKQSNAEVDFILPYKELLIPIEVKSGKSGTLRSLHQFVEKSPHPYAVRLYHGKMDLHEAETPTGKKYRLLNLPYCFAGKIYEYLDWFINSPYTEH